MFGRKNGARRESAVAANLSTSAYLLGAHNGEAGGRRASVPLLETRRRRGIALIRSACASAVQLRY